MVQRTIWFLLETELDQRKIIANGKKFLDLGTGPATQAIWLVKRGFSVIGSDLSEAAINRARKVYASEKKVNFIADDIVNTKLKSNEFDYIFDRGCFHVLSPRDRKEYINKITRILKDNGILFLKCFSDKEPMKEGPYKFSLGELRVYLVIHLQWIVSKRLFIKRHWIHYQRHFLPLW